MTIDKQPYNILTRKQYYVTYFYANMVKFILERNKFKNYAESILPVVFQPMPNYFSITCTNCYDKTFLRENVDNINRILSYLGFKTLIVDIPNHGFTSTTNCISFYIDNKNEIDLDLSNVNGLNDEIFPSADYIPQLAASSAKTILTTKFIELNKLKFSGGELTDEESFYRDWFAPPIPKPIIF